jgi:hypothetical protein
MRRSAAAFVALAGLCVAGSAAAQDLTPVHQHKKFESPQHFAVEIRFAPYWPDIDSDPAFAGIAAKDRPYASTFGNRPWARLLFGFEVDWQIFRIPHVASVGIGGFAGYTGMSAPALKADGTASSASTNLEIFPFYTVGVVRFDGPMRDFSIPVVPYVKLGVGWGYWHTGVDGVGNSTGTTTTGVSASGEGLSWGPQLAVGAMLQLDVFDPRAARGLDESLGINHTYLYVEGMYSGMGIPSSRQLRIGTTTWVLGLAVEF